MSGFFSIESPFYKFMSRLFDMLKLNVLWLLTSGVLAMIVIQVVLAMTGLSAYSIVSYIPLVTIGAATSATFFVTTRMVDEQEGYMAKPFFRAYRENFKKGNIIGWIMLIAVYAIWLDFQFYHAAEELKQNSLVYLIIGIVAVLMSFTHLIFAFPLQARYENSVINTLRNSHSISIKFFVKTIFLFIILALLVGFFMWNSVTQLLCILIGPATLMLAVSGVAMQSFRLIENENEARENDREEEKENEEK